MGETPRARHLEETLDLHEFADGLGLLLLLLGLGGPGLGLLVRLRLLLLRRLGVAVLPVALHRGRVGNGGSDSASHPGRTSRCSCFSGKAWLWLKASDPPREGLH